MKKFKRTADKDTFFLYLGVDPGQDGALAIIGQDEILYDVFDFNGDEFWTAQHLDEVLTSLEKKIDYKKIEVRGAIERVHSMPGQGIASSFRFGTNYGVWRGIFAGFRIPFVLPTPQTWQKGIPNIIKHGKKAIAKAAQQLHPDAEIYGPRGGLLSGRSDAIMIAEWRRKN